MARYKDIDKLLTDEMTHTLPIGCGRSSGRVVVFVEDIENAPTADVVPRDDVRRIFEEIEQELVAALESNYRVYREHLEKYGDKPNLEFLCMCNAKTNALRGIEGFVEELKEKYTGGGEGE